MGKKGDPKMKQYAAFMKERGIKRTTGKCPMGCGASIANGGEPLLSHLRTCNGKKKRK